MTLATAVQIHGTGAVWPMWAKLALALVVVAFLAAMLTRSRR